MKRLLSILLLAGALAASPAAGQTIKGLGFNTTNGEVVYSGTNTLRFTNAVTRFNNNIVIDGTVESQSFFVVNGTNGISFETTDVAALTRTNLGLGGGDSVTFGTLQTEQLLIQIGTNVFANLADDQTDFLVPVVLGSSLAVTGNATLSGVANLAPAQTADSASSLMTRDLVGQEFANPRNKFQTTYWFGMEGLGFWQLVNAGAAQAVNRGPRFGVSLGFFTGTRSSANASGLGLRLGGINVTGGAIWRPLDGGAFTARTHVVNYFSAAANGNHAFGFSFAAGGNTNFWAQPNSFGLFYVQQPTNVWVADTAFVAHDRIAAGNVVFAVATAGTTATNEPNFPDLINSLVTNGTVVFRNLGPHTSNNWVLAMGSTNASEVIMTNTGKTNWLRATGTGHDVLLTLRYGTNTAAPFTVFGSVADGTGQGAEVSLDLPTNNVAISPQYWMRYDTTNTSFTSEAAGIRYFALDAELPPLN